MWQTEMGRENGGDRGRKEGRGRGRERRGFREKRGEEV